MTNGALVGFSIGWYIFPLKKIIQASVVVGVVVMVVVVAGEVDGGWVAVMWRVV